MTINENGLYNVTFSFCSHNTGETRSDALTMYGVEIHAGEDVEEICEDWLEEDVKDPSDWEISKVEKQGN